MSVSLLASSSLRKSFVFWARSLRCVSVSRWCATSSEATVSSWGMSVVRSMSGAASAPSRAAAGPGRTSPGANCLLKLVVFFARARGAVCGLFWLAGLHVYAALHGWACAADGRRRRRECAEAGGRAVTRSVPAGRGEGYGGVGEESGRRRWLAADPRAMLRRWAAPHWWGPARTARQAPLLQHLPARAMLASHPALSR